VLANTEAIEITSNSGIEGAHTNKKCYKFCSEDRYSVKRESCLGSELLEMRLGEGIERCEQGRMKRKKANHVVTLNGQ
jgi:hypothetical protein